MFYWVEFTNRSPGTIGAGSKATCREIAEKLGEVKEVYTLPYPASPYLNKVVDSRGQTYPAFCYTPHQCKGRSSCPHNISCSE